THASIELGGADTSDAPEPIANNAPQPSDGEATPGCSVSQSSSTPPMSWLLWIALFWLGFRRRTARERGGRVAVLVAVGLALVGCGKDTEKGNNVPPPSGQSAPSDPAA